MFDPEELIEKGWEAVRAGHLGDARDLFAQAGAESRFNPDRRLRARALAALAKVERDLLRHVTAVEKYRESAAIYKALGDELAWAHVVRHVADIFREQKKLQESSTAYQEAFAVYSRRTDGDGLDFANALRGFALLKDALGYRDEALLMWRCAIPLYQAAGVAAGVVECQSNIAFLMGH